MKCAGRWFFVSAVGVLLSGMGLLALLVLQPSSADAADAGAQGKRAEKRFFVVAPDRFHAALQEFVQYKRKLLPTELVSLEDVRKSTGGVDDPERLKRFLYSAWKKRALGYVPLVGDVDVMPVRYMVLDRVTPNAFDYAFYPSDLYYSDLARQDGSFDDWNAQKSGFHAQYFGEVRDEKNKRRTQSTSTKWTIAQTWPWAAGR